MAYRFTLPIGDVFWDGHGNCKEILATSTKPIGAVREANRRIPEVTGIDLSSFCCDYEDTVIPQDVLETLNNLGYKFTEELYEDDMGIHILEKESGCDIPKEIANIWAFLLNQVDPALNVQLVHDKEIPSLLVSGSGDRPVGYGLFH